jgi:predicted RNase H-like HicB family nuclease
MKDYHINVFHSEENDGYIADIPDLQVCSAFGSTTEEAVRQIEVAKAAWLKAAKKEGKPIPEPRYRPAIYQSLRGALYATKHRQNTAVLRADRRVQRQGAL